MKTINTITIIWWRWNFWSFIKKELEKIWFQVNSILEDTDENTKKNLLENSDVIIFSVPIRNTIDAIKNLVWINLKQNALVMDVTWIKTWISEELKKLWTSEFVSIHPMFWPSIQSLNWKNIVITSSEKNTWKKWKILKRLLIKAWWELSNLSESEHDKKMAFVQATSHFLNLVFWNLLKNLWVNLDELNNLATPNFKGQEEIFLRILRWQSWSTFADMEIENPEFRNKVLPEIINSVKSLWEIVWSWDSKQFETMFWKLQEKFL